MSDDDLSLWANYLDNKLDIQVKRDFEKMLLKSPKLLRFLTETKKTGTLMEKLPLQKVPQHLMDQVLTKTVSKRQSQNSLGELTLDMIARGFNIIKDTFSVSQPKKELLAYRDIDNTCEKLFFFHHNLKLSFWPITRGYFNLEITFLTSETILDNVILYIKSDLGSRMLASLTPVENQVTFPKIPPGQYIVKLNDKELKLTVNDL